MDKLDRKELKHDRFVEEVQHSVEFVSGHKSQVTMYVAVAVAEITSPTNKAVKPVLLQEPELTVVVPILADPLNNSMIVPFPNSDSNFKFAFISPALCFIFFNPFPRGGLIISNPIPLSRIII